MTTPIETAAGDAATQAAPPVKGLSQAQKDAILKVVDAELDGHFAARVEANFQGREALIERERSHSAKALAAMLEYRDLTGSKHLMGHLFHACAVAGHAGIAAQATRGVHGGAERVAETLEKSLGYDVAKTLTIGDAQEGGLLVEGAVLELFLEPLRAASVVLSLLPEEIPVAGDTFKLTGFETDPQIVWTEEVNRSPLVSTPTTGLRQTAMRKAMALVPISRDYRENASPAVFQRLENMMAQAFVTGFDRAYITGDGLVNQIFGLRNLITQSTPSAGTTLTDILEDFRNMMVPVEVSNVPALRFGIIMNPRSKVHLMLGAVDNDNRPFFLEEMRAGTVLGWPYRTTTTVPANLGGGGNESYMIGFAANQLYVATGTAFEIEWFRNISYTDGATLVSSIERDTEVLAGRRKTATLMPYPTAGHITTNMTWGA